MAKPFTHRLLLGWINDIASRPLRGKRWPIIDVGEETVQDYMQWLRVARDYGYSGVTIWGLYVSHAWPVPLQECLRPDRRRVIDRILCEADRLGIKVLAGIGVYSWGFEEIIRHDPATARSEGRMAWGSFQSDNGVAMCYHSERAKHWMREVVDLCAREIGTQGFGLQSGDLGRCYCRQCQQMSETEYHAHVIGETAEYIKQQYPGQVVGISAWGVDLGEKTDVRWLRQMTQHADFLTDVTDQSAHGPAGFRRRLAQQLPCSLGSLGGAVVVPPQRWDRERWFLPHVEMVTRSIKSLNEDGGRAFEFFMGPLDNPQYALMTRYVGLLLSDPGRPMESALGQVIDDLYSPAAAAAGEAIAQWLLEMESAYFRRVEGTITGEFDFEPLKGEEAGEAAYLQRLSPTALAEYGEDLRRLAAQAPDLARECRRPEGILAIGRCLQNVLADVAAVRRQHA